MSRPRIEARLGACVSLGQAWLPGYALRFHKRGKDDSGKCDAWKTSSSDDLLYGVIYSLDWRQRERLDQFEGRGYRVSWVEVRTPAHTLRCFVYVARPEAIDAGLTPFDWYLDYVLAGAKENRLPSAYISHLESIQVIADPDGENPNGTSVL